MIMMMPTTMTWTRDRMAAERAVGAAAAVLVCPFCQLDAIEAALHAVTVTVMPVAYKTMATSTGIMMRQVLPTPMLPLTVTPAPS